MKRFRNLIGAVVALLVLAGAAWLLESAYGGKSPGTQEALTFASSLLPTPAAASPSPVASATAGPTAQAPTAPPPPASPGPTATVAITLTATPAVSATVAPTATASLVYRADAIRVVGMKQLTHDGYVRDPDDVSWSPGGDRLVYPIPNGRLITETVPAQPGVVRAIAALSQLWLYDLKSGDSEKLADNGELPKWSADGRYLLFGAPTDTEHDNLEVLDLATGQVTQAAASVRRAFAWLGAGGLVAVGDDHRPFALDRQTGLRSALTVARPFQQELPVAFAVSPDSRWITFVDGRDLWLAPVGRLDGRTRLSDGFDEARGGLAWSPGSDRVAYNEESPRGPMESILEVASVAAPSQAMAVSRQLQDAYDINWSPDGRVLAFVALGAAPGLSVMLADAGGSAQPRVLIPPGPGPDDGPDGLRWSPAGAAMVVQLQVHGHGADLWLATLSAAATGGGQ
jgi:Tol biopolymer transport system component